MRIEKFNSTIQKLQYSKLYRLPKWILRKIMFRSAKASTEFVVDMRIGHKICLFPTQNYLKNTLINRQYHDENVFYLKHFLKKNSVIIDIGANIGLYTCAYAQYFKKLSPTIFAFEAIDTNYDLLKKNININKLENVRAFHIALGENPGFLEFNLPSTDFTGNVAGNNVTSSAAFSEHGMIVKKTRLDTLDNLANQENISSCDFIKVDIEGAELFFFKGAINFIKNTRPVIQFEYNKFWLEKNSISFKDFSELFQPLNYVLFIENEKCFSRVDDFINFTIDKDLIDFLLVPNEKT